MAEHNEALEILRRAAEKHDPDEAIKTAAGRTAANALLSQLKELARNAGLNAGASSDRYGALEVQVNDSHRRVFVQFIDKDMKFRVEDREGHGRWVVLRLDRKSATWVSDEVDDAIVPTPGQRLPKKTALEVLAAVVAEGLGGFPYPRAI